MERREWFGTHAAALATLLVALLSVATGLVNISSGGIRGPLAPHIPEVVRQTAGFTGTLTGFCIFAAALSLRHRSRAGWWATVVLLPLTAAQGLLQASPYSYPLVVLSALAFPVVLLNRRYFDREHDLSRTELVASAAILGGVSYGTLGAYALREQFANLDTLLDAFYFTMVTASTVGYGDMVPQSQVARLFGLSALVVNVSAFAVAIGVLLTPAIEARLSKALGRMTESQLDLLDGHVIVCGYGELTEPIIEELESKAEFVVITDDEAGARELSERGINVLTADPSDETPLQRAGIDTARAVVAATNNDANDALSILTARQLNPEVHIAAAVTQRENVEKLRRAGADSVISPATIGGHLLVESALGGEDGERVAERLLGRERD